MSGSTPENATDPLAAAMGRLYGVALEEFMATRTALVAEAKQAGDKPLAAAIGKLRKPSLGAWAVNLVARHDPETVSAVLELGARMRAAQSALDAAALTGLRGERDAAVDGFVRAAVAQAAAADRALSGAGQDEVRATAIAALADAAAAEAVASGQLTKALSYSGFGEVDLSDAVVRTSSGAVLSVIQGGAGRTAEPAADDGAQDEPEDAEEIEDEVAAETEDVDDAEELDEELGDTGEDTDDETGEDSAEEAEDGDAADERTRLVEAAERALSRAEAALRTAERRLGDARRKADLTRERVESLERQLATAKEADERAMDAVADAVQTRRAADAERDAARARLEELEG